MIPVPKMPEFVAEHERQLVLGLHLPQQAVGHDNQAAGQRHGIGGIGIVDLDAKLVR